MLTDQHARAVGQCIIAPRGQEQEYNKFASVLSDPQLINIGNHDAHIDKSKKTSHDLVHVIFGKSDHITAEQEDHKQNDDRCGPLAQVKKQGGIVKNRSCVSKDRQR